MQEIAETMTEYVLRKLDDPQFNLRAICRKLVVSRTNVYHLIKTGDGKASLVQTLASHFKTLGE